jgi:agmatinase
VLDPTTRWHGGEKPDHAGLLTFAGLAYTEDARELAGVDVAIVGPPMDELVDVDVLDPAFAPGTDTPEPGGMTPADLLWACRRSAERLQLAGADVVEVAPTAVGAADTTALVADRIVRGILTGIALRRRHAAATA